MLNNTHNNPGSVLTEEALEKRVDALQNKLTESGHRVTPQRLQILRALLDTDTHPTAEDIWEKVRETSPTTSLATIYKTLETLQEMGEVMELNTRDDKRHYDALRPVAHPHVICNRCGKIEDVEVGGLDSLHKQAIRASGYWLEAPRVTFYGLCRACQEQSA